MDSDEARAGRFPRLPLTIRPEHRLELEMIVLDQDSVEAGEFLTGLGIEVGKGADPLGVCAEWLKRLLQVEHKKHNVRYDDKGPTIDLA